MIAAHLRKERALTRCRYSVENCPPPPARERPVACYNFEKPRVRRVNRDACRRGAGAQLLKGLLEDKLRRTWAALAPAGPPPRLAQAAPAAVAVVLAARRAVDASATRRLRGAWTALRGSDLRPLALLLGACASRWRRNSIDGAWRALGRGVKAGRRSEQRRRAGLDAVARALDRSTRIRRRRLLLRAFGRVLAAATANPAPTPCTAVTAAVANVARSQNRRRKLRALDQLRRAARATKVLLRVLRFRVVAEKRTALARLRRGGDCRRRHAVVGGALVAANRRWHRRRKMRAVKQWARIVRPKWADRGAALRACGAMAVAAARRAAWARLAHHDRIHRHGVFRVQCLAAVAAATARRRRAELLAPVRCRALETAKHVALRATAAALARARARRAWSQWRVRAAARGARRAVEKAVACAHHASARLDGACDLIGGHWDLARKLGFYVLRGASRPANVLRMRRAFTRWVGPRWLLPLRPPPPRPRAYAAAAFIVLHGRRRVQAESCTAAFREWRQAAFLSQRAAAARRTAVNLLSRCVARRADRRLRAALANLRVAHARRRALEVAAVARAAVRADAAYADAARRISDAETRTGFALAAAQDAEARAKAGTAAAEKRAASAIAAAAQAAATAREAAATVAVEARERAMADLAALRAASARDVASVKADADAAVAAAVAERDKALSDARVARAEALAARQAADTSAERNQKATEDATLDALAARPAADATTKRDQKATADADRRPRKVEEATPLTRKVRQAKRDARAARKKAEKRARLLVKLTPLLVRCGADTVALYFRAWRRRTQLSRPGVAMRSEASVQVLRRMARRGSISAAFVLWRRAWLQSAVSAPGPASPHALAYAADY